MSKNGLSEEEEKQLIESFRLGDFSLVESFIEVYTGIANHVAQLEAVRQKLRDWDDVKSEAMLAVCAVPGEINAGREVPTTLKNYVCTRVRTRCREYLRSDKLVKTPYTSVRRGARCFARHFEFQGTSDDHMFFYDDVTLAILYSIQDMHEDNLELQKEILSHALTDLERVILTLTFEGFNDAEIARRIGTTQTKISRVKQNFVIRIKRHVDFVDKREF